MRFSQWLNVWGTGTFCVACSTGIKAPETVVASQSPIQISRETEKPLPLEGTSSVKVNHGPSLGDRKVHEFRGSLYDKPLQLTEEVVARTMSRLTYEYTLCQLAAGVQEACPERLRVHLSLPSKRVLEVERFDGRSFVLGSQQDYDRLFERTVVTSERNLGAIEESHTVCLIGTTEIACKKTRYSILLQGKPAELEVAQSAQGTLSGEVRALDGSILHHSELVELSRTRGIQRENSTEQTAELHAEPVSSPLIQPEG